MVAHLDGLQGPQDPRFRDFIKQVTQSLFPFRNPDMNGKKVTNHPVPGMRQALMEGMATKGLNFDDMACVIRHQANLRIIDAIGKRLDLPPERADLWSDAADAGSQSEL